MILPPERGQEALGHLMKVGGEEVEGSEDGAIGAQVVVLHHRLVVHRVPDVDVGLIVRLGHGRVQVYQVCGNAAGMRLGVDALSGAGGRSWVGGWVEDGAESEGGRSVNSHTKVGTPSHPLVAWKRPSHACTQITERGLD